MKNKFKDRMIFLAIWIIALSLLGILVQMVGGLFEDDKPAEKDTCVSGIYIYIDEKRDLTVDDKPIKEKPVIKKQDVDVKPKEVSKTANQPKVISDKSDKPTTRGGTSRTFIATAYTDDEQSQGKWVGQTASGIKPGVGVVAVDPKVIPLGTKLYIEGYNNNKECIAGDTGGDIKGNRLDLFFNTRAEALEFGRKNVQVKIVK